MELCSPCVSLKIITHPRTFVSQSDSSIQRSIHVGMYVCIYSIYIYIYIYLYIYMVPFSIKYFYFIYTYYTIRALYQMINLNVSKYIVVKAT